MTSSSALHGATGAILNLPVHDALDGGGPSSMRMDPLGKGMAQMLLDLEVQVPQAIAAEARKRRR